MKLEFLTKPNYLFEAVTLIVQTMQLDDDFDLENMHLSSQPEKLSVSGEELDERYKDILEYKKRTLNDGVKLFRGSNSLKIISSEMNNEVFDMNLITSITWMMKIRDADEITDELLLRASLNSILSDYYNEQDMDYVDLKNRETYKNSTWSEGNVKIEINEIIELISALSYDAEQKWLMLDLISNEVSRSELINNIRSSQSIIERHFHLVENRYDAEIEKLKDEGEQSHITRKIFGNIIDGMSNIAEHYNLELAVLAYNSASILATERPGGKSSIIIGILLDELMELTGHFKLNDNAAVERCKALGDAVRFKIINILSERPHYVKELAEKLSITSSTLSHHLSILTQNGLLLIEVSDRKTFYKTNSESLEELSKFFQMKAKSIKE